MESNNGGAVTQFLGTTLVQHFRQLESALTLIADAVEKDPCCPDKNELDSATKMLNHGGLHVPDYNLFAAFFGIQLES